MPQIQTIIKCNNCDYDHGQTYYNTIPDISIDSILESFNECSNESCGLEICDNCIIYCDICQKHYCGDCYDNDIQMCQNCKDERSQCNECNNYVYKDDLVLDKNDIAICQECKES